MVIWCLELLEYYWPSQISVSSVGQKGCKPNSFPPYNCKLKILLKIQNFLSTAIKQTSLYSKVLNTGWLSNKDDVFTNKEKTKNVLVSKENLIASSILCVYCFCTTNEYCWSYYLYGGKFSWDKLTQQLGSLVHVGGVFFADLPL